MDASSPLRHRLREALTVAMRARDRLAMAVLRSTLAAIDNAESVDGTSSSAREQLAIEQIPRGVGANEVARRTLTESEVEQIVRTEIAELVAATRHYDDAGQAERAAQLRREVEVLSALL
jgi:uncharacterized protein